jgi:hypothetical protein
MTERLAGQTRGFRQGMHRPFFPSRSMLLAALWSRWRLVPQSRQVCQQTDKSVATSTPQPEQIWLVSAAGTATTCFPAHAALNARMVRNSLQPIAHC